MQGFARGRYAKTRKNGGNNTITKIGDYSLVITDILSNAESRNFAIIAPIVGEFTHNFDDVSVFKKVVAKGEDNRLNYGTLSVFPRRQI